jgi:thioredoxin reductase
MIPNSSFAKNLEKNPAGEIVTDKIGQTNVAGIFAAGDVSAGSVKRVSSAVGAGTAAVQMIREYLSTNFTSRK